MSRYVSAVTMSYALVVFGAAASGCYMSHQRAGEFDGGVRGDAGRVDAGVRPDAGMRDASTERCVLGEIVARDYEHHFAQLAGATAGDGTWLVGSPMPTADEPRPIQLFFTTALDGFAPEVTLIAEPAGSLGYQVVDASAFGSRIAFLAARPDDDVRVFVYDSATDAYGSRGVREGAGPPTYGAVALSAEGLAATAMTRDPDVYAYIVTPSDLIPVGSGTLGIASTVGVREGRLVAASYTRESSRLHLRFFGWSTASNEFIETEDVGLGPTVGRWGDGAYAAYGGASVTLFTADGREDLPPIDGASSFYGLPSVVSSPEGHFVSLSTNAGLFIGIRTSAGRVWVDMGTDSVGYQTAYSRDSSRGTFALSVDFTGRDSGRLLYRGLCNGG